MSVSPLAAGLACVCPQCGKGALFDGYLKLAAKCAACGLDFAKADSGDGPAVFVIFVVGFVSIALAFIARFVWEWPTAAAFGVSAATAGLLSAGLLRIFKATLIALQFKHNAAEGRPNE